MKHNVYYDGKVQSLGFNENEGYATLGVIDPGVYTFSTSSEERMTVVAGSMRVRLPGGAWTEYGSGAFFVIPPGAAFDVEASADVAYLCRYR